MQLSSRDDAAGRPGPAAPVWREPRPSAREASPAWYAVWTHSQSEQLVCDQLDAKGFRVFLPRVLTWVRRGRRRTRQAVPVFPSYLFVHHGLDKASRVEVLKSRGVVRILGDADGPVPIPDAEIGAIERVLETGLPAFPHPYFAAGQRVRITGGALAGVEGVLVQSRPAKGLLVVSVNLLQRSVAVEVDCTLVEAA